MTSAYHKHQFQWAYAIIYSKVRFSATSFSKRKKATMIKRSTALFNTPIYLLQCQAGAKHNPKTVGGNSSSEKAWTSVGSALLWEFARTLMAHQAQEGFFGINQILSPSRLWKVFVGIYLCLEITKESLSPSIPPPLHLITRKDTHFLGFSTCSNIPRAVSLPNPY